MHWIDPNCLPETQGAVEGFIANRHGEIDGVLLAGPRPTSLLVCMPPHLAAAIEAQSNRRYDPRSRCAAASSGHHRGGGAHRRHGAAIVDDGPGDEDEHEATPHRDGQPRHGSRRRRAALALRTKGRIARRFARRWHDHSHRPEGSGVRAELLCPGARIAVCGDGLRHQTWTCHCRGRDWAGPAQYEARQAPKIEAIAQAKAQERHDGARTPARRVDSRLK